MTNTKEDKLNRLKSKWKELAIAIITIGGVLYFIFTGTEVDLSAFLNALG